jgi:DHA1 family bicyclomycin/chloramphenicol resistance-like MFS transporter
MTFADWRAIFYFLAALGVGAMAIVVIHLRETVAFDLSRIHLRSVVSSYGAVLRQPKFLLPSLVIAGTSGTVYAQAPILPFVMMDQIGLSAAEFGLALLMQPVAFFLGSMVVRQAVTSSNERQMSAFGLVFLLICAMALPLTHLFVAPSYWSIMLPIAVWGWGVAFILPIMTTAALDSFPSNSGAAAAMLGFLQMGSGLVGGLVAGQFSDPSQALFFITPAMLAVALISWVVCACR